MIFIHSIVRLDTDTNLVLYKLSFDRVHMKTRIT